MDLPDFPIHLGRKPFTEDILLRRMDMEGIDQSVLLPITNPENVDVFGIAGNNECIMAARRHPDRLIAFFNVDPRSIMNQDDQSFLDFMKIYVEYGCRGIGEMCACLPVDDIRYQRLFHHAGEMGLPIIFHFKPDGHYSYGAIDDLGLPRLERMVRQFPQTIFLGHSACFWNEIDGNLQETDRNIYPNGKIAVKGRLWDLLDKYPNLYCDCSAGSGYNALSRDKDVGYEFMERFQDRICFGTDRFTSEDEPIPAIIALLKGGVEKGILSTAAYDKMTFANFEKITVKG